MSHTIDPKKFDLVWGGIRLNEGLAEGTYATLEWSGPAFTSKVGVDGKVTRARMHDRRATLRISLMQSSAINDRLSAALNADRDAVNGAGVAAFLCQDRAGTTVLTGSKAWISAPPSMPFGGEAEAREWAFEISDLRGVIGGNPED